MKSQINNKKRLNKQLTCSAVLAAGAAGGLALTIALSAIFLRYTNAATPAPLAAYLSIFAGLLVFWLSIFLVVILDTNQRD